MKQILKINAVTRETAFPLSLFGKYICVAILGNRQFSEMGETKVEAAQKLNKFLRGEFPSFKVLIYHK